MMSSGVLSLFRLRSDRVRVRVRRAPLSFTLLVRMLFSCDCYRKASYVHLIRRQGCRAVSSFLGGWMLGSLVRLSRLVMDVCYVVDRLVTMLSDISLRYSLVRLGWRRRSLLLRLRRTWVLVTRICRCLSLGSLRENYALELSSRRLLFEVSVVNNLLNGICLLFIAILMFRLN